MPKIKPETKVLIIKNLKSKSPAELADIFNVSKQQVERICKRYQETGDFHDRPRSGRPGKTTARDDSLLVRLTAPGGVDASDACFVKNCTSDSCSQWCPWLYCCPETSAKQETAKKPRIAYAKTHSLTEGWTAENVIFQMNHQLSSIPRAANIVEDPQGPVLTHGSPRRQSNLEVERLWFGVTSNMEVPGRSVRWMVTLIVPNINRFLPPSTFPTTRGVRFFNMMELLAIPPLWSFSGGRRSRSFRDGQHSLVIIEFPSCVILLLWLFKIVWILDLPLYRFSGILTPACSWLRICLSVIKLHFFTSPLAAPGSFLFHPYP